MKKLLPILLSLLILSCILAYKAPSPVFSNAEEASLFSPYIQKGVVLFDIKNLKKGDTVELIMSHKESFYLVKAENTNIVVPYKYIKPIYNAPISEKAENSQIEDYANKNGFKSKTKYLLWTDQRRLETYLLRNYGGKWKLIKRFPCSAGSGYHPTPRGNYEIAYKAKYIGKKGEYICKYALSFYKDYMYHSVVYNESGNYVTDGRIKERISNGCIRMNINDITYIYKTVPILSAVYIN